MFRNLVLLLLVALVGPSSGRAGGLFPADGTYTGDLLALGRPAQAVQIEQRIEKALAADPKWASTYLLAQREPGTPLPYSPKLGVTKAEYSYFLQSAHQMVLERVGDATVRLLHTEDGVTLDLEGEDLPLTHFTFGPSGEHMSCRAGVSAPRVTVDATDPASPTGPWRGSEWVVTALNGSVSYLLSVRLTLGLDAAGRALLTLRVVGRKQDQAVDFARAIRWDLP